jgi:hypothetical protein
MREKTADKEREENMKSIAATLFMSKAQHLGFAAVCALLLTGGVYAKVALDRFGDMQDEACANFNHPSQFHLWYQAHHQNKNAIAAPVETKTVPPKPATNGPALL